MASLSGDVDPDRAALTVSAGRLLRHGRPHQILAGSVHYFRVPPALWQDRLGRLVDLGLNTVDTYVPWNFHQRDQDVAPDFSGWRDVAGFLALAQEAGLDAIVRPGPYICAEWTNGGLPAWLTAQGMPLRSAAPAFLAASEQWLASVLSVLAPLQAVNGGPIVAFQVENEFGSFGDDPTYVASVGEMLRRLGATELLYTADGPTDLMLDGGTIPDAVAALTFGSKASQARLLQSSRRPEEPFFCAEFWNGWFDHWGHPHHVRDGAGAASVVKEIVEDGGSVSIYMAHGGTNFGLWAGANRVEGELRPTTTSYDSDAPIAEDGTLTEKFFQIREALGVTGPVRSQQPVRLAPFDVALRAGADLLPALEAVAVEETIVIGPTCTFESLGLDAGLLRLDSTVTLPSGDVRLNLEGVGDLALVYVDGVHVGTVRETGTVTVSGPRRTVAVTLVIENLGRVNYGPRLGEPKGLLAPVLVERRMIQRWRARTLPLDRFGAEESARLAGGTPADPAAAGAASGSFTLADVADAFVTLPDFGKGFVWVNGFLLGRYWSIGPQQTLYVPRTLLREGVNDLVVLDLERRGAAASVVDRPELGPAEQYIEEF